jgi:hypothetical protein
MATATGTRGVNGPKKIDLGDENLEDLMPEVSPEPIEIEAWTVENGQYVKKMVPRVELVEDFASFDDDTAPLSASWYEGRGKEMEAKWLNCDTRFSSRQMQEGWVKVSPDHYQDTRYQVKTLPGIGQVITFQDCFLAEMPKEMAEAKRKAKAKRLTHDRLARMYGVGMGSMDPDAVAANFGDNAAIINTLGKDDGFRQGIERETLNALPYDSPMAREARALADSVTRHHQEATRMNRLRNSLNEN